MKIITKIIYLIKFLIHNKKYFNKIKFDSKDLILLENYNYLPSFIAYSYFANILSKKYKANIFSYNPRVDTFSRKMKSIINPKIWLNHILYRSFNVRGNIIPKISINQKKKSYKLYRKIYSQIKKKEDILRIKIFNIPVGDLIYDEFLRFYKEPTIDFKKNIFQKHLNNMLDIFIFWIDFFKKNKVKSVVISHSVYATAIISRIAIFKNIKVFNVGLSYVYSLNKKNALRLSGFNEYKKNFQIISKILKKDLRKIAKKELNNKLYGKTASSFSLANNTSYSAFSNIKLQNKVGKKEKILVASHCLTDAVHAYGNNQFVDFYSWMEFLGKISTKTNFEWLIKIHPSQYDLNLKEIENFTKKFPKFTLLNKNISHNEILNSYNILGALTVYGSIGHEYPLFGVPVINASINNPHSSYSFNINTKSKKELENKIINIRKLKKPINQKIKNEIYEFYYMRYQSEYYCLNNLSLIIKNLGSDFNSLILFRWWLNNFNLNHHNKILNDYSSFIDSKKFRMHGDNTGRESIYIDI